jgi:ferredoxin
MLSTVEKILFALLALAAAYFAFDIARKIAAVVGRGRGKPDWNAALKRLPSVLVRTATLSPVWRTRPVVSFFHALIAWGFIFYLLVNFGDLLEGYIAGLDFLGGTAVGNYYRLFSDLFSAGVLVGMVALILRRFVLRDRSLETRDSTRLHPKASAGKKRDSLIVGSFVVLHISARGWRSARSYCSFLTSCIPSTSTCSWPRSTSCSPRSGARWASWISSTSTTKHRAVRRHPAGRPGLGADYGCLRLHHVLPLPGGLPGVQHRQGALTGRHGDQQALFLEQRSSGAWPPGEPSSQTLLEFAISEEAVWACTACGACVDICPVGNEPMRDILDIRRSLVLMENDFPDAAANAFRGMERTVNPWNVPPPNA